MSPKDQEEVLRLLSKDLLDEAYFVEKAGIVYSAKMALLSKTIEEQELYAHFTHQEACHLEMLEPFLDDSPDCTQSEFLILLRDLVESGDKQCMTYFIQILLEGFGLHHYQSMRVGCNEPTLVHVFDLILKDEAQHYRSGLALYAPNSLTVQQNLWITRATFQFQDYVRKGPIRVINAISKVYGKLHINQYNQFLLDIGAEAQIKTSLKLLESLQPR